MVDFPTDLLRPRTERWRLAGVTLSGGVSVGGMSPVARTDGGGLWVCEQSFLLATPAQRKAARALLAQLDGGAATIAIPRFVGDDGPGGVWEMDYSAAASAALRATTATVSVTTGLPLTGGESFSITHPTRGRRIYDVATAGALTAGEQTITFRPPLREAVTTEALDFRAPSCVMRLTNPDEFMGALGVDHIVEATAVWVEAFDAA